MSTPLADVLQISALVVALVLVHRPFGDYMAAVYSSRKHLRAERLIYRWIGADPFRAVNCRAVMQHTEAAVTGVLDPVDAEKAARGLQDLEAGLPEPSDDEGQRRE